MSKSKANTQNLGVQANQSFARNDYKKTKTYLTSLDEVSGHSDPRVLHNLTVLKDCLPESTDEKIAQEMSNILDRIRSWNSVVANPAATLAGSSIDENTSFASEDGKTNLKINDQIANFNLSILELREQKYQSALNRIISLKPCLGLSQETIDTLRIWLLLLLGGKDNESLSVLKENVPSSVIETLDKANTDLKVELRKCQNEMYSQKTSLALFLNLSLFSNKEVIPWIELMDLLDKLLKTLEKTTDPYLIALSSCRISVLYFHVGGLTKATHYAEIALTKSKKITTQSHRRWFTILALTLMIEIGLRLNQCDQISLNKLRSI